MPPSSAILRAYLVSRGSPQRGRADCFVDRVDVEGDGWRVEMCASRDDDEVGSNQGFVLVGPDLRILEEDITA